MSEHSSQTPEQNLNISGSVLESVQIGGIAGRDFNLTQIQGGVSTLNVFGTVQVAQASISATKPISQEEYRWRIILLNRVKQDWIEGVLKASLQAKVLIKLGLEDRQEFAQNPLNGVERSPLDSRKVFPEGTAVNEIFEGIGLGRTLLILGEPGAGKTTTLLKLAESLIARAENDLSQPLPVVVNLSSWAQQRKPIDSWLVQELSEKYHVSKILSQAWVEQEQLILLLDGLDEVDAKYRNDCVKSLNQFIQKYGSIELVVCSRIRDYEHLSERLRLRSAIYVQSLTWQQMEQFLEYAGEPLSSLRKVLKHNAELQSFASSPLILSMMSLAYQNCSIENLTQLEKPENQKNHLFDAYIDQMFMHRDTSNQYSRQQTLFWLRWLAQRMIQTSQTIFLIERLQPSWLISKYQRFGYRILSALVFGLLVGVGGLLDVIWYDIFNGGWFKGLFTVFFGSAALLLGLIYGLVVGLSPEIKTVETLKWSWKEAGIVFRNGMIVGITTGLLWGAIITQSWTGGLIYAALFGCTCGLIFGLLGGFRGSEVQKSSIPNQGIWKSASNASISSLISLLIFGLILGFVFKLPGGLFIGVISGSMCGGLACFQHYVLRLILNHQGNIPWNYAHFLDYASDKLFMQKVGGGYIFIHRMLLEHVAQVKLESK